MNRKLSARFTLVCLILALTASPVAAQTQGPLAWSENRADFEGWKDHGNGLWTRTLEDGTVETEAYGKAGLIQVLERLDFELVRLVEAYLLDPTDEMKEVLDTHVALIQRLEQGLASAKGRSEPTSSAASCSTNWSASAGQFSGCGNFANASSSYFGDSASACFGLCDLYSYAYVRRTVCNDTNYTASQSCNKPNVINQSCSSSVSLTHNPVKSCDADAYSSIYCPGINWFRSASKDSSLCGGSCSGCVQQCTVTADCSGAGGGTRSCSGTCAGSFKVDNCYAYCDGNYYWCPNPPLPCPV